MFCISSESKSECSAGKEGVGTKVGDGTRGEGTAVEALPRGEGETSERSEGEDREADERHMRVEPAEARQPRSGQGKSLSVALLPNNLMGAFDKQEMLNTIKKSVAAVFGSSWLCRPTG